MEEIKRVKKKLVNLSTMIFNILRTKGRFLSLNEKQKLEKIQIEVNKTISDIEQIK